MALYGIEESGVPMQQVVQDTASPHRTSEETTVGREPVFNTVYDTMITAVL